MLGLVRFLSFWAFAAAAAYQDIRYRRVPNRLVAAGMACGLACAACAGWKAVLSGLGGLLLGLCILYPAFALHCVGGGDVKCLAVVGAFTGPRLLWVSFLCGALAGGAAAIVLLLARFFLRRRSVKAEGRAKAGRTLPYAAFMVLAAGLTLMAAPWPP